MSGSTTTVTEAMIAREEADIRQTYSLIPSPIQLVAALELACGPTIGSARIIKEDCVNSQLLIGLEREIFRAVLDRSSNLFNAQP